LWLDGKKREKRLLTVDDDGGNSGDGEGVGEETTRQ